MEKLNERNIAVKTAKKILKNMMDNKTPIGERPMKDLIIDMAIEIRKAMDNQLSVIIDDMQKMRKDMYPITF